MAGRPRVSLYRSLTMLWIEGKVDMGGNFAKQVILGYEVLQTDYLELRSGFLLGSEH